MRPKKNAHERKFYVYAHNRLSDGSCFYIGKGTGIRKLDGKSRNDDWYKVVEEEGGFKFTILVNNLDESKALELEKSFIHQIGYDNLTNIKPSGNKWNLLTKEVRDKIAYANKHRNRKKVVNTKTGEIFGTMKKAAKDAGIKYTTFAAQLNGTNTNYTDYVLFE